MFDEKMPEPTHQTVGWAIEQLKQYPPDMQLRFATGPETKLYWLSDYPSVDNQTLWIDIGDDEGI